MHKTMEHEFDCHDYSGHEARNMAVLQKKRRQLLLLKEHMVKINALHDKIDTVMSKVEKGNIGLLLTQQKNLRELEKECAVLPELVQDDIMPPEMLRAEQEYIENVRDIMHHARLFKRGLRGNVTEEVLRNLERKI